MAPEWLPQVAEIRTCELDAVEVELLMLDVGYSDHVTQVAGGDYCSIGKPDEVVEHQGRSDGMPG